MASEPLLRLQAYSQVRADGTPVLQDLSFELGRGEILGVVGESGSGKSQLLLGLLGLAMPGSRVSGSACFEGIELAGASELVLRPLRGRKIAMLFQDPLLTWNPCLTLGSQLIETARLHLGSDSGTARAQVLQALAEAELPDAGMLLDRYPHEISGGMRQRALLAMSVLAKPALLLADEPTTALDPTTQRRVLARLASLRERGMSILLVTHDLGVVAEIADRVLVLQQGVIVEQGATAQLLRAPASAYARTLLDAARQMEGLPCLP
ncbi:MAG: ABC transporter ATP-binding protein [Proteobacteria bacterium]|nr:ABC transporter ATP-binding protein [Pseudomonadota bacterium]